MGIDKFVYFLLLCSVMVIIYEKDTKVVVLDNQEKPEISFYDSTAYDITTTGVDTIIKSKEAYFYKTREELIDGTVISKGNTKNSSNVATGSHFIKIENQLYIDGDVNLQLENGTEIETEQLEYNIKTKIAKNNLPFKATQYNHTYIGTNLYLNMVNRYIKSDNTQMRIKVTDE